MRRHPTERDETFTLRKAELIGLCEAAGAQVQDTLVQERADIDGRTYLGSGKLQEVALAAEGVSADIVVFDAELTPSQVRNIEAVVGCRILDRTQVILDIFALRAQSRAGRLQVEIAQLQYLLPRLTGRGREMSRLGAGIGTRGPGESKLETDRRRIRDRIARLRHDLATVRKTRSVQRDKREGNVPVVALVGYTNAGKTTVLHRWTQDKSTGQVQEGQNRLFDTLDPLARRVKAGSTKELVLLDTVGFVQDLPHFLVEAFQSTLEEVAIADVIVHVVDATADVSVRMQTTYQVLDRLSALNRPVVTFFNKMDAALEVPAPDVRAETTVYGSAQSGDGMDKLYRVVNQQLGLDPVHITVEGLTTAKRFWDVVGTHGKSLNTELLEAGRVRVTLEVERRNAAWVQAACARLATSESVEGLPGLQDDVGEDWSSSLR